MSMHNSSSDTVLDDDAYFKRICFNLLINFDKSCFSQKTSVCTCEVFVLPVLYFTLQVIQNSVATFYKAQIFLLTAIKSVNREFFGGAQAAEYHNV